MKLKILAVAVLATIAAGAWAKGAATSAKSANIREIRSEVSAAMSEAAPAAVNDVGDADSFGRNVKYMGLMSTGLITLAEDCTPDPSFPPGPEDHCVTLNPQPALTTFNLPDVARMVIKGKSSQSLFCHHQTPVAVSQLRNNTASVIPNARISMTPTYTLQNDSLNDPSLIDPTTGLPFNGQLTVSLGGIRHQLTLQPGEGFLGRNSETRACIGGLVSRRSLMETFGLTGNQADKFFKKDTLVTLSLTGSAQAVEFSSVIYGTRWYGD